MLRHPLFSCVQQFKATVVPAALLYSLKVDRCDPERLWACTCAPFPFASCNEMTDTVSIISCKPILRHSLTHE